MIDPQKLITGLRTRADMLSAAAHTLSKYPSPEEKVAAVVLKNLADVIEDALVAPEQERSIRFQRQPDGRLADGRQPWYRRLTNWLMWTH